MNDTEVVARSSGRTGRDHPLRRIAVTGIVATLAAILLEYALGLIGVRRPQTFELIVFAAATEVETSPEPADLGRRKNLWVQRFKELRSITDQEARRVRRRDDGPSQPGGDALDLRAELVKTAERLKLPHAKQRTGDGGRSTGGG